MLLLVLLLPSLLSCYYHHYCCFLPKRERPQASLRASLGSRVNDRGEAFRINRYAYGSIRKSLTGNGEGASRAVAPMSRSSS